MTLLYTLILLLPLLSFLTIGWFGARIGVIGTILLSCTNMFLSFTSAFLVFLNVSFTDIYVYSLWNWSQINGFDIIFAVRLDTLTIIMFVVFTVLSTCVHFYSCAYMYSDPNLSRFLSYLSLFTFFMLLLVASNNFLVLFLWLDGLVLCSYLLIGFWHTRVQAGNAATKAFLINNVGDLFLLAGLSTIMGSFYTLDFATLSNLMPYYPSNLL